VASGRRSRRARPASSPRDDDWAKAKRLCRLSVADVEMARQLGLNPRKLIQNIPSPSQRWKAPMGEWVRELYRERFGDAAKTTATVAPTPPPSAEPGEVEPWELEDGAAEDDSWLPRERRLEREIREQDEWLARRQQDFRIAADYVAAALARLEAVHRIVLFGSVARPLRREVPRFKKFRRAGVDLLHECKDVDLAVWVADTARLDGLRKTVSRAVTALFDELEIGVAHHQVDLFLFAPGSDQYLGRLCAFGTCPKGKPECAVPRCGARLFLRQHAGFVFDPRAIAPSRSLVLYDRARGSGPPQPAGVDEPIPF